jgi:hypothetical protein
MPAHALLPAVNRLLQQVEETSGLPVASRSPQRVFECRHFLPLRDHAACPEKKE